MRFVFLIHGQPQKKQLKRILQSYRTIYESNRPYHYIRQSIIQGTNAGNRHIITLSYSPTIVYNASKHQISISITTHSLKFLTNAELKHQSTAWTGTAYDSNNLQSANE